MEAAERTAPDIVLLDLSMPGMDGLEAIPLMRQRAPGTRTVVLSGHEPGRVSLVALGQGATRYVTKAADLQAIRDAVREVARLDRPFAGEGFDVVRRMWIHYLDGDYRSVAREAVPDAVWLPYDGPEMRSPAELIAYLHERRAAGRAPDPRAHGVEPCGAGLIVAGTVSCPGIPGQEETEVHWAFGFRERCVSLAARCEDREAAARTIRERCVA